MILSLALDGYPPDGLMTVVERLSRAGVQATFFANPTKVLDHVSAWQSIASEGHEIGNAALSGVSLSGELLNWTRRMVEQDLHMTQSFLEDLFPDQVVPVFSYPGPFTRCSDGDYREVVEGQFAISIAPVGFPVPEEGHTLQRELPFDVPDGGEWNVVGVTDLDQLEAVLNRPEATFLPIFEAARRTGRVPEER